MFSLNQSSGQLSIREGAPPGSYRLQVRVSDRTWPDVTSTAQVDVRELKQDALQNAASVRISSEFHSDDTNVTTHFLHNLMEKLFTVNMVWLPW